MHGFLGVCEVFVYVCTRVCVCVCVCCRLGHINKAEKSEGAKATGAVT